MNFWGFLGLIWIWISGSTASDGGWVFVCNVLTTIVLFITSFVTWIESPDEHEDDDEYDDDYDA
jgi:hypothetical protein